jgi:hypothetical protein
VGKEYRSSIYTSSRAVCFVSLGKRGFIQDHAGVQDNDLHIFRTSAEFERGTEGTHVPGLPRFFFYQGGDDDRKE